MATTGMFDWNPKSQLQLQQEYLQGIVGDNPDSSYRMGAEIGASLGRLFGGKTAQEAEQNIMKDVFSQAAQEQDPVKRLQTAAALFRQKGMEGRARQLEAELLNTMKAKQDLALGGMNIQSLIDERNARVQALKDKETATAEALAQRKKLASVVQRKIPDLSVEEAEALVVTQPDTVKDLLKTAKTETEVVEANGRKILINKATGATIADIGAAKKGGIGSEIAEGLAPLVGAISAKKAAEGFGSKYGQLTGEQAAQVDGKYAALDNIKDAKDMLKGGIYAGQWGPEQLLVAKGTKGFFGDQKTAENTEQFLAYVGNIVIPRLKEFGGNDSEQELKFLQNVMAGNQRLEPKSMESILTSAEKAINRGLERLKRQAGSIAEGTAPPLDAGPSRSQPKPTQRFNPATGKLEKVQ